MARTGWEAPESKPTVGASFLRLKDGEQAVVRFLGEPTQWTDHWLQTDGQSQICSKRDHGVCSVCDSHNYTPRDKARRQRFSVAVYVHAVATRFSNGKPVWDEIAEVRIFENSGKALQTLVASVQSLDEPEEWKATDFQVARTGAGTDTTYAFTPKKRSAPVREGIEVPDVKAYIEGKEKAAAEDAAVPSSLAGFQYGAKQELAGVAAGDGADDGKDPWAEE